VKIAITGTNGRVGGALSDFFRLGGHEVISLRREDVDLCDLSALREALESLDFDAWINPAAMSSPDECERNPVLCDRINTIAPALMADVCRRRDKYLLHFSTDYVFAGDTPGKCHEDAPAHPLNAYGKSKREGELALLSSGARATVLRVSWVYGAQAPAFVEQCVARLQEGADIAAIADKWSIPTAMPDLCHWVEHLLIEQPGALLHGCHSGEPVSWYGIAVAVHEIMRTHGLIDDDGAIVPTLLQDARQFIARRPIHTAMDNHRLSSLLPRPIADWREALERVITARRRDSR
jgi:dTDP-4-dehydrorhamnose reductase